MKSKYGTVPNDGPCPWYDKEAMATAALAQTTPSPSVMAFVDRWGARDGHGKIKLAANLLRPRYALRELVKRSGVAPWSRAKALIEAHTEELRGAVEELNVGYEGAPITVPVAIGAEGARRVLELINANRGPRTKDRGEDIARHVALLACLDEARAENVETFAMKLQRDVTLIVFCRTLADAVTRRPLMINTAKEA